MTRRANRNSKLRKKLVRTTKRVVERYSRKTAGKARCCVCGAPARKRRFLGELCFNCAERVTVLKARGGTVDAALRRYVKTIKLKDPVY